MTVALLPASRACFNNEKSTVAQCASVWKNSTIQVMNRTAKYGSKPKMVFVIGYGNPGEDAKTKHFKAHHDQTGRTLGDFDEIGRMFIREDGTIDDPMNYRGLSAPVLVYK